MAKKGVGKLADPSVKNGFKWLTEQIEKSYTLLNGRIEKDVAELRQQQAIEKKERMERIRQAKAER